MRINIGAGQLPHSAGGKSAGLVILFLIVAAVVALLLAGVGRAPRRIVKSAPPKDPNLIEGVVLKREEHIREPERK